MLSDAQMEAVTTCQEHLEGDMVGGARSPCSQISWSAGDFTVIGNVTKVEDIKDYKEVRGGSYTPDLPASLSLAPAGARAPGHSNSHRHLHQARGHSRGCQVSSETFSNIRTGIVRKILSWLISWEACWQRAHLCMTHAASMKCW